MKESTRGKINRKCEEMHHHEMQDVERDSLLCLLVSTESHFIGLCTAQEMVNKFRIKKVPLILTKYIRLNNSPVSRTGSTASEPVCEVLGQKKLHSGTPGGRRGKKALLHIRKNLSFCEKKKKSKQTKNSHRQITLQLQQLQNLELKTEAF